MSKRSRSLLGVANEENAKRDDQQDRRACGYDGLRPFGGRNINHVATGQLVGAFWFATRSPRGKRCAGSGAIIRCKTRAVSGENPGATT